MKDIVNEHPEIKGWGIDVDTQNDPTYPMKNHTVDEHDGYNWQRPTQQPINIEVLHSNERPNVPAVFGTSVPPSGVSGMIRRFAFRFGEGSYAHWLPLVLADRVNEVEGVLSDLWHGHIPNFFAEAGWKAEWKYNKQGLFKKILVGTAITAATVWFFARKKK